jgi:hypothetical protein
VALGACATAIYMIGSGRSYGYDESVTVGEFIAPGSVANALTEQIVFNNHPVLSVSGVAIWAAGGTTEAWMRLVPAVAGGVAVAALVLLLGRRAGLAAAGLGGALLAASPEFAELARQARGYSIGVAGVVVATVLLTADRSSVPRGVGYVASMGAAIGAHLFTAFAGAVHAVHLWAAGRLTSGRRAWLLAALLLGLSFYVGVAREMSAEARGRPRVFREEFPVDLAGFLVPGRGVVVTVAVLVLAVLGVVRFGRSSAPAAATAAACVLIVLVVWAVMRPQDLYPRFFAWLLPVVPFLAALGARRSRVGLLAGWLIVGALMWEQAGDWTEPAQDIRAAAQLVERVEGEGGNACAIGGEALVAYVPPPREVTTSFGGCDLVVRLGSWVSRAEFVDAAALEGLVVDDAVRGVVVAAAPRL